MTILDAIALTALMVVPMSWYLGRGNEEEQRFKLFAGGIVAIIVFGTIATVVAWLRGSP